MSQPIPHPNPPQMARDYRPMNAGYYGQNQEKLHLYRETICILETKWHEQYHASEVRAASASSRFQNYYPCHPSQLKCFSHKSVLMIEVAWVYSGYLFFVKID